MKCRYTEPEMSILGHADELAEAWIPLSSNGNVLGRLPNLSLPQLGSPFAHYKEEVKSMMKCLYVEPELNVIGRVEELTEFFLGGYQDHVSGRLF